MSFGRLGRSQGAQPFSDINVTPLVDVMLVLVVILIITAPLLGSAIRLNLPSTDAAQPISPVASLTLVVDNRGQAFLNDQPLSLAQLSASLAQTAAQNPATEIQLRADAAVPYGQIVAVMGVAQKAGLSRIGFVAEAALTAPPTLGAAPTSR